MSDASQEFNQPLTPAQRAQIAATQAAGAVQAGAPIEKGTTTVKDIALGAAPVVSAQTIPGDPAGVAGAKNPSLVTQALPGGGRTQQVIDSVPATPSETVAKAAEGSKQTAPVAPGGYAPPGVPAQGPYEQNAPAAPQAAVVDAKKQEIADTVRQDPSIGDQLLDFAKRTGQTLLGAIQGFAIGMSRSDKPLQSELEFQEKLQQQRLEALAKQQEIERDFQMNLADVQNRWLNQRFSATQKQELDLADRRLSQEAQQAALDRQNRLDVVAQQLKLPIFRQGLQLGMTGPEFIQSLRGWGSTGNRPSFIPGVPEK